MDYLATFSLWSHRRAGGVSPLMTQPSVMPGEQEANPRSVLAHSGLMTQPSVMPGEQEARAPRSPERPVTWLSG
jgi:hypothetical protein